MIRVLAVARWNQFAFFVISTALLGYGISGIALLFLRPFLLRNFDRSLFWLTLGAGVLGQISIQVAQQLPLDSQYLMQNSEQLLLFVAYNALLVVPFLLGASAVALCLMQHPGRTPVLYSASLIASAWAGISSLLCMYWLSETRLPQTATLLMAGFAVIWAAGSRTRKVAWILGTLLVLYWFIAPPPLQMEPYKSLAAMQRLERQGSAKKILSRFSPRGRIDVYESPLLHFTLFAGYKATAPPPAEVALLHDGQTAGVIFRIDSPAGAEILDEAPTASAYTLRPGARVLLLGETGGTNVWLARRHGAQHITVVQQDPQLVRLMLELPVACTGGVYSGRDVSVVVNHPRLFLERSAAGSTFDVVHLVSAEETAADTRGAGGLQEDYLLTVQGLSAAWNRLSGTGILVVTRGVQVPARDTLKFLNICEQVLKRQNVENPGAHIVLIQNYLANTVLLFRSAVTSSDLQQLKQLGERIAFDILWPGGTERQRPAGGQFPGLDQTSWTVLSGHAETLTRKWVYDIRPSTDNRPFFRDFFRIRSLRWMQETYGGQWFQRVELGYSIVVILFLILSALAFLLILLPVAVRQKFEASRTGGRPLFFAICYFALIGAGFMGIEMSLVSKFSLYLGDPLLAATTAITSLLVGAGAGSLLAGRSPSDFSRAVRRAIGGVLFFGTILVLLSTLLPVRAVASWSLAARVLACGAAVLPVAFFMGRLFPCGLAEAARRSPALVPWAWAVNGFASVVTPPLVLLLSMGIGLLTVQAGALLCYALILPMARNRTN